MLLLLSILSPLPALIIGFKKRTSFLWYYALLSLSADLIISGSKRLFHYEGRIPSNLFVLLEFFLLSAIFKKQLYKHSGLFWCVTIGVASIFITTTFQHSVTVFNMTYAALFILVYILYAIAGFYKIISQSEIIYLERSWFFWFCAAILIYASGNFTIFIVKDYMVSEQGGDVLKKLWGTIGLSINITMNLLLALALYHYNPKES